MLHPAEPSAFLPTLTITCGANQVQTYLEPATFDLQGRTLISIRLMLAVEQLRRPTLTLAKLWLNYPSHTSEWNSLAQKSGMLPEVLTH